MKKLLVVLMVIFVVAMTGEAMADTTTVTVSARVVGACQFNSGGSMDFSDIDPSGTGNITATVTQPTFWCTKNANYTITDDNGLNESGTTQRLKSDTVNPAEYIPYTFTYTANGSGSGPSTPITLDIAGQIADGDYQNVSEDTYSDTVTLTINP